MHWTEVSEGPLPGQPLKVWLRQWERWVQLREFLPTAHLHGAPEPAGGRRGQVGPVSVWEEGEEGRSSEKNQALEVT